MTQVSAFRIILPAVLAAALAGCGAHHPEPATSHDAPAKRAAANDTAKPADDLPGLKKLSAADRKLAERQKTCPISGALLGSMDEPYKITLKGRTVFLCCKECEADAKKDPDGTLRKVDALLAKK